MHTQGDNQEELLSAGFQQVQHQQDAKSKLQGNSGIIPGKVRDGSGSCPQVFQLEKEFTRVVLLTKACTRATSQNMLVPLSVGLFHAVLTRSKVPTPAGRDSAGCMGLHTPGKQPPPTPCQQLRERASACALEPLEQRACSGGNSDAACPGIFFPLKACGCYP